MEQNKNNFSVGTLIERFALIHKLPKRPKAKVSSIERDTVMTVFASSLFILALVASVFVIALTLHAHGRQALSLRAHLRACPGTMTVCWKVIERVPLTDLGALRTDRAVPRVRAAREPLRAAPRLEWPQLERAA